MPSKNRTEDDVQASSRMGGAADSGEGKQEVTVTQAKDLAIAYMKNGDWGSAEIMMDKILTLLPEDADTRHLQAVLRIEQGRLDEAETLLLALVEQSPRRPHPGELRNTLGRLYWKAGKLSAANDVWTWITEHYPQMPEPWLNMAEASAELRQWDSAIAAYQRALLLRPVFPNASIGLALAWVHKDGWAASIPYWQMAIAQSPNDPDLLYRFARACFFAGHHDEARRQFQVITQRWPKHWAAWHELCACLEIQGDISAARVAAERVLELAYSESRNDAVIQSLAQVTQLQRACAEWDGVEEKQARLRTAVQKAMEDEPVNDVILRPFQTLYLPFNPEEQLFVARQLAQAVKAGTEGQRPLWDQKIIRKSGRMRIAYLIADVKNHPNAQNTLQLYGLHDREQFEVFTYSWGEDCSSDEDRFYRQRIVIDSEHFVEMKGYSDGDMAARIAADGIQILVDLMGYTQNNRSAVLARRPAPIQIQYLGYPGTMGADFVDYIIGDEWVTPLERSSDFAETILQLPDTYQINSHRAVSLEGSFTRSDLGLPENGFVYCCFNNTFKIAPEVFARWAKILANVPDSVLWLLETSSVIQDNLRAQMRRHDLDPSRLVFAPFWKRAAHFSRLQAADLFLDTSPYGAHTTAADALWAAVPVLTVPGDTFASRVCASVLHAAHLDEAILPDWDTYQKWAIALAKDDNKTLLRWKEQLRMERDTLPLFDTPARVRALEETYRKVWGDWQALNPKKSAFKRS